jgi:hypothetical protein
VKDLPCYTPASIDLLERDLARLRAEQVAHASGDRRRGGYMFNFRRSGVPRTMLILDLVRLGCTVVEHPNSLIVDGRFEVAADRKRWRRCGEATWRWYKTLPDLLRTAETEA